VLVSAGWQLAAGVLHRLCSRLLKTPSSKEQWTDFVGGICIGLHVLLLCPPVALHWVTRATAVSTRGSAAVFPCCSSTILTP
jgi:hypothetical protein